MLPSISQVYEERSETGHQNLRVSGPEDGVIKLSVMSLNSLLLDSSTPPDRILRGLATQRPPGNVVHPVERGHHKDEVVVDSGIEDKET